MCRGSRDDEYFGRIAWTFKGRDGYLCLASISQMQESSICHGFCGYGVLIFDQYRERSAVCHHKSCSITVSTLVILGRLGRIIPNVLSFSFAWIGLDSFFDWITFKGFHFSTVESVVLMSIKEKTKFNSKSSQRFIGYLAKSRSTSRWLYFSRSRGRQLSLNGESDLRLWWWPYFGWWCPLLSSYIETGDIMEIWEVWLSFTGK